MPADSSNSTNLDFKRRGNEFFRLNKLSEAVNEYRQGLNQPGTAIAERDILLMNIVLIGIKSKGEIDCDIEFRQLENEVANSPQRFPGNKLHKAYYRCSKYLLGRTGDIVTSYQYLRKCEEAGGNGPELEELRLIQDNYSVNILRERPFITATWRLDQGITISHTDRTRLWNLNDDCAVCGEKFATEGMTGVMLTCGHWIHSLCAIAWLARANTCYTCRTELFEPGTFRPGSPLQA